MLVARDWETPLSRIQKIEDRTAASDGGFPAAALKQSGSREMVVYYISALLYDVQIGTVQTFEISGIKVHFVACIKAVSWFRRMQEICSDLPMWYPCGHSSISFPATKSDRYFEADAIPFKVLSNVILSSRNSTKISVNQAGSSKEAERSIVFEDALKKSSLQDSESRSSSVAGKDLIRGGPASESGRGGG
jgi:hypothetical protein